MRATRTALEVVSRHELERADATDFATRRGDQSYATGLRMVTGMPSMVHEEPARYSAYESEGSEHRSLGSLPVGPDARWTATLTVPIPPRAVAFLEVERRGELPAGYRGAEERAFLSLPIGETGALIELLTGVVAQARRDGVLPAE